MEYEPSRCFQRSAKKTTISASVCNPHLTKIPPPYLISTMMLGYIVVNIIKQCSNSVFIERETNDSVRFFVFPQINGLLLGAVLPVSHKVGIFGVSNVYINICLHWLQMPYRGAYTSMHIGSGVKNLRKNTLK